MQPILIWLRGVNVGFFGGTMKTIHICGLLIFLLTCDYSFGAVQPGRKKVIVNELNPYFPSGVKDIIAGYAVSAEEDPAVERENIDIATKFYQKLLAKIEELRKAYNTSPYYDQVVFEQGFVANNNVWMQNPKEILDYIAERARSKLTQLSAGQIFSFDKPGEEWSRQETVLEALEKFFQDPPLASMKRVEDNRKKIKREIETMRDQLSSLLESLNAAVREYKDMPIYKQKIPKTSGLVLLFSDESIIRMSYEALVAVERHRVMERLKPLVAYEETVNQKKQLDDMTQVYDEVSSVFEVLKKELDASVANDAVATAMLQLAKEMHALAYSTH